MTAQRADRQRAVRQPLPGSQARMTGFAEDKYRLAVREVFEQALTDSGLTQEAFARAMGTSGSRYSTYRRGIVMPRATTMVRAQRIAAAIKAGRETHKDAAQA